MLQSIMSRNHSSGSLRQFITLTIKKHTDDKWLAVVNFLYLRQCPVNSRYSTLAAGKKINAEERLQIKIKS